MSKLKRGEFFGRELQKLTFEQADSVSLVYLPDGEFSVYHINSIAKEQFDRVDKRCIKQKNVNKKSDDNRWTCSCLWRIFDTRKHY